MDREENSSIAVSEQLLGGEKAQTAAEEFIDQNVLFSERTKNDGRLRTAMSISVLGLILSVFFGAGIIFSVVGLVVALMNKSENPPVAKSAVTVSLFGLALSVVFAALAAVCIILAVL